MIYLYTKVVPQCLELLSPALLLAIYYDLSNIRIAINLSFDVKNISYIIYNFKTLSHARNFKFLFLFLKSEGQVICNFPDYFDVGTDF